MQSQAARLTAVLLLLGSGWAAGAPGGAEDLCESLTAERARAISEGDLSRLERAAKDYVQICRKFRFRGLVSVALEEIAAAKRMSGRMPEAVEAANACLLYSYEAVGCHAEKALALAGMGLAGEARDVVESGRIVGNRELARAQTELAAYLSKEGVAPTETVAQRMKTGALREKLAQRGLERLRAAQIAVDGGAR